MAHMTLVLFVELFQKVFARELQQADDPGIDVYLQKSCGNAINLYCTGRYILRAKFHNLAKYHYESAKVSILLKFGVLQYKSILYLSFI